MTHNNPSTQTSLPAIPQTLDELMQRKAALLQEIRMQKDAINRAGREVLAPLAPAAQKGNGMLRAFNRGMAVFDGVMIGLKVIRKFRSFFGKKRRYSY